MLSGQTRRQKSREVNSRYLSPTVPPPLNHNHTLSPDHHNLKPKHTGFIRGLWPSSASKYNNHHNSSTSLPNHETRKRSENSPVLSRQKSYSEKVSKNKILKLIYTGRPSISSSSISSPSSAKSTDEVILPGRLSVDENALRRRSSYYQMRSDGVSDNTTDGTDQGSPLTVGRNSPASYMAPTLSSRKSMHNYNINSPKISTIKSTMKRVNSSSPRSEWESSPSRFGPPSFSSSKPPTSSKRNILHIGLDLIKGKKRGSSKLHSPLGTGTGTNMENVHQLRMLQNSLMRWRYANARAQHVHDYLAAQSENKLLCGYESVAKLRQSVVQKRLQLQKEKLEMKLNLILHSQTKMLEAWGEIERRHMLDVSVMKDYLHAVVCMIPVNEGAKADLESATTVLQHTSDMADSIKSVLSSVSPTTHETMAILSELAEVVTQEKLLLEACIEHLRIISSLEIQEIILRRSIMAMDSSDEQRQQVFMQLAIGK
ncbi:QWRF motif-containing protein 3-like [Bidens hawaiensis]|uniref:QWRF motif-containing protein 3-like n=1 Tax=Bidens hawaiensis TaxID=980011 RepID=UPI00404B02C3